MLDSACSSSLDLLQRGQKCWPQLEAILPTIIEGPELPRLQQQFPTSPRIRSIEGLAIIFRRVIVRLGTTELLQRPFQFRLF